MKPRLFLVLVLVMLAGCGERDSSPMASEADIAASLPPQKQAALVAARVTSAGPAEPSNQSSPAVRGRMIIRSADVRIVAADPAAIQRNLSAQIEAQGGFVSDSKQWVEDGKTHATLTLRVPAAQLTRTLAEIRKAALRTDSETVTGQDVSQEYTDLSAQLTNLQATELQLRELLVTVRQKTQRASDVLEVFNRLAEVRGKIDQTKGRLLSMGQQVEMATITLAISPDAVATPPPPEVWRPTGVAAEALSTLGTTLKWLCDVLIWACLYVAPLAILIGISAFFLRRAYRSATRGSKRPK